MSVLSCSPGVPAQPYDGEGVSDASAPIDAGGDASRTRDAGSGKTKDASTYGHDASTHNDASMVQAQLPSDVQAILNKACAGAYCHVGASIPALGLDMSADAAFADLVGVASQEVSGMKRVVPGNPDASYLICKVSAQCADRVGSMMPEGAALSAADIDTLRAWITGLNNVSVDDTAPTFAGLASATSSTQGAVQLTWSAAQDDTTAAADLTYNVYLGTTPLGEDFTSPEATLQGQTSTSVTGLVPGKTYYFVVRAVDQAGNIDTNDIEHSVTVLDTTPPVFAGVTSATATGGTSVALSWVAATDNGDASAIRYRVYAATSSGGQAFNAPLVTTAAGVTQVTVSGLSEATMYYFVVRAVDAAGLEDQNTVERSATTLDATPPSFAGATSATGATNAVQLTWNAASDAVTSASGIVYLVYQASASGAQNYATPTVETIPGATSVAIGGLNPNTTYYFVVRARDVAGNIDTNTVEVNAKTPTTSDHIAPTFSGASAASASSETAIDLSWSSASDNTSSANQITYLIYRATSPGGENYTMPTYTTAAGAVSYQATGLSADTTYYFVVRAKDQAGNIDTNTQEVSAKTLGDNVAPQFAGLSSAVASSGTSIALSWTDATDNVTPTAQIVYEIYRAQSAGAENFGSPTYTTSAGATSFTATGLATNTQYYFVVRARDLAGNLDTNSVEHSATTSTPSFSAVIAPLLKNNCASKGCHGGAAPQQGLNLSSTSSAYSGLVNVASQECPSTKRVEPGSPSASYLMWKLQGSGSCYTGSQMPKGAPPLSASDQDTISAWISGGALNN